MSTKPSDIHSEEHFRSLIRGILDLLLVFDAQGSILYASSSVSRILGYSPSEMMGKNFFDSIHVEDTENTAYLFKDLKDSTRPITIEFRFRHRDGSWRTLETIGKSIVQENNSTQVVVSLRDVTDREEVEEALKQNTHRLLMTLSELQKTQSQMIQQERLKALGQMASGIAHDFNNALAPIVGFSELILSNPDTLNDREKATRYLKLIHTAAKDAVSIVGRLIEFYRKRNDQEDSFNAVDLCRIIEQCVSLTEPKWKNESLLKGASVKVELKLDPVPLVTGHESALREALTNLIFNAVDAMPQGGVLRFETQAKDDEILILVSDTGAGMSEEVQQRCFEPFFSTKGKSGTGMGLSMVHGIIRRHEGTIDVISVPSQGTTFTIHLPIHPTTLRKNVEEIASLPTRPLRILLADDEPLILEVVKVFLTQDGHTVETALDGNEALKKFQTSPFDLLITDRAMPPLNGDMLIQKIKEISPKTPAIMLTGFADLMKEKGDHPKGMDLLIGKPASQESLRQAINKITQKFFVN